MLDKLIEFIISFWNDLAPYFVINEYQEGLILRFGKYHKSYKSGIHWKIPFFDDVLKTHIITTTLSTPPQSLCTKDNFEIVIEAVVKYQIEDSKKFLLDIYDTQDGIQDITQAIIKEVVMEKSWEECKDSDLDNLITKKVRSEVKKYGIKVEKVTLVSITRTRSLRLIGNANQLYS